MVVLFGHEKRASMAMANHSGIVLNYSKKHFDEIY